MASTINELYLKYVEDVGASLEEDRYFQYLFEMIQAGSNELQQRNQILHKVVDEEWLSIIEDTLDSINTIIDKPRRFVATKEELVPVALAKKINADSVKHLSQNTQFIASNANGEVHPSKILNVTTEESFDLYENRFIYHLIQRLVAFVDKRTDVIFWSTGDEKRSTLKMKSKVEDAYEDIEYNIEMKITNRQSFAENDSDNMDVFMRIDRVRRLVMGLRQSSFCSLMAGCAKVRSPIQRTNLMMKDPHYRKCYTLWHFLESYDDVGYNIDVRETAIEFDEEYLFQMYTNLITNYTVFKTLMEADERELDSELVEKKTAVKPKFIKEIKEEFVEDYNLPDVEIRKVFVEEVTEAQLEAEAKLAEETERRKEIERIAQETDEALTNVQMQFQQTTMQLNDLMMEKVSIEEELEATQVEKEKVIEESNLKISQLESDLTETKKDLDKTRDLHEKCADKLSATEKQLTETKATAEAELAEAKATAAAELAETKATAETELADTKATADKKLTEAREAAKAKLAETKLAAKAEKEKQLEELRQKADKELELVKRTGDSKIFDLKDALKQAKAETEEAKTRIKEEEEAKAKACEEANKYKEEMEAAISAMKEAQKAMAEAEARMKEAEKLRDKALAKAEGTRLSRYIIAKLNGNHNEKENDD